MKKKIRGGIETVIAAVILIGIIVAILCAVVVPMSKEGNALIADTTGALADQDSKIRPPVISDDDEY